MGKGYLLFNWDTAKILYQHSLFGVSLGPFVDSGKIFDPYYQFSPRYWFWDTGLILKVRSRFGPVFQFSWGKDLQTGHDTFYIMLTKQ